MGLFEKALKRGDIDFKKTFFIGDKIMDVQAGRAIGCRTILVLCGKESLRNKKKWKLKPAHVKRDLPDAVDWILKKRGKG
ncbi:MAG: HAD hydrolase-like protein [Candidatus Omnitrophota bacterium]|nr:HAD hydrolase-like protein [Candidatus Omnitrophota bacterium]